MEKDRSTKIIAIIALFIAVIGLSIGFAAFSDTLTIRFDGAASGDDAVDGGSGVKQDASNWSVKFSTSTTAYAGGTVYGSAGDTDAKPANATIDGLTISGLGGTFTKPGDTITYEFNVVNLGKVPAYLNSVNYGANTSGIALSCTGVSGTSADLVEEACKGFEISVTVGSKATTGTVTVAGTETGITGHKLNYIGNTDNENGYEKVTVVLKYKTGAAVADGDFKVAFGNVTLGYDSTSK